MFKGLYTAYTGMLTQQRKMDAISNNLANVDTAGFKKDNMIQESFEEILTYKIHDPEMVQNEKIGRMSLGVQVNQVYTDFSQGSMKQTYSQLDAAIQGKGFFKVGEPGEDGNMAIKYTRDGSFKMDQQGRLVTNDGLFVMGENDEPITIPLGDFNINKKGQVLSKSNPVNSIQMVDFEDLQTLRKQGENLYVVTDASVEKNFEGTVEQGFLESSNTNSIQEMIDMIATTRAYEANQKIIQTYDETMSKAVNNIGSVN